MPKKTKLEPHEIIEELSAEIRVYRSSYREIDGVVRNARALRTIAALIDARKIVHEFYERSKRN